MGKVQEYLRCRTCLKKTDPAKSKKLTLDTYHDGKLILKMLNFCIPELNLDLVEKPAICKKCLQNLNSLYKFKNMCLKNDLKYNGRHKKNNLSKSSEHVPFDSDINNSSTAENSIPHSITDSDLGTDVKQNENTTTNLINIKDATLHEKQVAKKRFTCYRKRFTNMNCFGCQNRIRDVIYHTSDLHNKNCTCLHCGKQFTTKEMRKHMYCHIYLQECKICGKKWRDAYQLSQHLRSHSKEKPYECPECGKRFVQNYNLHQHLAVHKGDKNNKNRCQVCGKILSTKYNLKIHMTTHNIGSKPRCTQCNKWFYTEAALVKHSETCLIIKKENEIFITEPEFIKTEVPEYVKEESHSDDDIFIEKVPLKCIYTSQQTVGRVKEENFIKLEEHNFE